MRPSARIAFATVETIIRFSSTERAVLDLFRPLSTIRRASRDTLKKTSNIAATISARSNTLGPSSRKSFFRVSFQSPIRPPITDRSKSSGVIAPVALSNCCLYSETSSPRASNSFTARRRDSAALETRASATTSSALSSESPGEGVQPSSYFRSLFQCHINSE